MFRFQSRSHPSTWEDEEKTIKAVCEQMKVGCELNYGEFCWVNIIFEFGS